MSVEGNPKLIDDLQKMVRPWRSWRSLKQLNAHSQPEDLHGLALKIALQRSRGPKIGIFCRYLGSIDAVNPQLVEVGDGCVIGSANMQLARGPGLDSISAQW